MDLTYPPDFDPATPAYILAVLQDDHRQQCQFDGEADSDAVLGFDTTVNDWRDACDLVGWHELGRALNTTWNINRSDAEWFAVLEPAGVRRLEGVCQWIASQTHRPRVRPARLLGKSCGPAGAFLTVRSLLHEAGEPVGGLRPATPLAPYARRHAHLFLGPIARLAPGALPPVQIQTPIYDRAVGCAGLGFLIFMVGYWLGGLLIPIAAIALILAGCCGTWIAAQLLPASVEFAGLQTFGDLAVRLDAGVAVQRE